MTAEAVPPPVPGSTALRRVNRLEVLALLLAKGTGLLNVGVALVSTASRYPLRTGPLLLAAALAAETAALFLFSLRQGRLLPGAVAADTVFCSAALALNAALQSSALLHNWGFFMYPFTIVASVVIGIGFRRFPVMFAWTAVLGLTYIASGILLVGDPVWNSVPNSISYFAIAATGWAVDREVRRTARQLDESRAEAVAQAEIAAKERERNRHQRMLHDRVLQTLEMLAQGSWVADSAVQARITEEAVWLRALVDGGADPDRPGDLLAALNAVIGRQSRDGLAVDLLAADLLAPDSPHHALTPELTEALVGAVHEALTNVRKHSGVDRATVRVAVADGDVLISVLDQGRGFDPGRARAGIGLAHSIRARVQEAGGTVTIDSLPGDGTCVELSVPLPGPG